MLITNGGLLVVSTIKVVFWEMIACVTLIFNSRMRLVGPLCGSLWSAPGCPGAFWSTKYSPFCCFTLRQSPRGYAPSLHPRSAAADWETCLLFCWRSFYGPTSCLTLRGILWFCPLYKRNARCLNFILHWLHLSYSYLFIRRWQDP